MTRGKRTGIDELRAAEEMVRADVMIQFRTSKVRKQLYTEAAKRTGKSLSKWLQDLADDAVQK